MQSDYAARLGIDWADQKHAWALQVADESRTEQGEVEHTPEAVDQFFAQVTPAVTAEAAKEAAAIQALINQQNGGFTLQPWDWNYYSEQVRKAKYDLDQAEVKPYFELNNVLQNGVFYAANQLYGLTFKERHDIPVYQPDVRVFEVFDAEDIFSPAKEPTLLFVSQKLDSSDFFGHIATLRL